MLRIVSKAKEHDCRTVVGQRSFAPLQIEHAWERQRREGVARRRTLLDGVLDDETADVDLAGLAETVDAVGASAGPQSMKNEPVKRLVLDRGRPGQVEGDDTVGAREIEPDAAAFEGHEHDWPVREGADQDRAPETRSLRMNASTASSRSRRFMSPW